ALSAPLSVIASVPTPAPFAPVGQGNAAATLASAATTPAGSPARALPGASLAAAARAPIAALPPFYQLVGFSATFAGGGYIVQQGDTMNGSGVMTAWSMLFLFFRLIPSLRPRAPAQPLPFILASSTFGVGSIYAAHYFTRTESHQVETFSPSSLRRSTPRTSALESSPTQQATKATAAVRSTLTSRQESFIGQKIMPSIQPAPSESALPPWLAPIFRHRDAELGRILLQRLSGS
ncbi:hypothetical protein OC844_006906, partial [Tilletia horrida]